MVVPFQMRSEVLTSGAIGNTYITKRRLAEMAAFEKPMDQAHMLTLILAIFPQYITSNPLRVVITILQKEPPCNKVDHELKSPEEVSLQS